MLVLEIIAALVALYYLGKALNRHSARPGDDDWDRWVEDCEADDRARRPWRDDIDGGSGSGQGDV